VQADSPEAQKADKPKKGKSKQPSEEEDRSNDPTLGVGSVAAGGRYDNLVSMFQPRAQIPCVGISFGVDRIFSITKARIEREQKSDALRSSEVDAYVMAFGGKGFGGMLKERMEICQKLWSAGLKVSLPLLLIMDYLNNH
jgi:Histidyl-tRNA synthetase